ncbi:MAG: beta-lactamase family protein [Bacteroidales bacterium]|nr:beta-lactamase family protein [Bacteroidales bacterium]
MMSGGEYFTEDMWSKTQRPVSGYFSYANINFGILGTLIERLSGKRFDKYCIEHIFKPLQMTCSFDVRNLPDINQVAVIYRMENAKWIPQTDNWKGVRPPDRNLDDYIIGSNAVLFAPQGGLRISVDDLTRFMMLHQQKGILNGIRILSDTAVVRMHEVVWKYNGSNGDTEKDFFTTYALGCMKTNRLIQGVEVLGHSGDAYGLLSGLYFSEKEDFGIVFITNGGEWKPGSYSGWQSIEEEVFKNCYEHIKKVEVIFLLKN